VQGEGDYESARRFNESERAFVKQHGTPRQPNMDPEEERDIRAAEKDADERGEERQHDAKDQAIFRDAMRPGADNSKPVR
jgi:hypothetical protein